MASDTQPFTMNTGDNTALASMDATVHYLTVRLWRVLPPYLVGMSFYSLAFLIAIDVVTSQHRSAITDAAWLLTGATVWRWIWLGVAQRRVLQDVRGESIPSLWRRLPALLVVRLFAIIAIVWGGLIVVPAYYGLFLSGFATPMMLDTQHSTWTRVTKTLSRIHRTPGRLTRVTFALTVLTLLTATSVFVIQFLMAHTILPSLLGFDSADLIVTIDSLAWFLTVCYFLFVILDFYWTVLAVILFDHLRFHRLGGDLRIRIRGLKGIQS